MSFSRLPLGYCTNVHPGRSVAEVEQGLDRYTLAIQQAIGRPLAAGLWLARPVVDELLSSPDGVDRFREGLLRRGLTCHTLNAFPYGEFHSARVKENVYLPDWSDPRRLDYTANCAAVLADLLPPGVEGSISTLPLGFKGFEHPADFMSCASDQLIRWAIALAALRSETGQMIRLAIEPEPLCILETTDEAIRFFQELWHRAGDHQTTVREHIGLCYDICHQAVEFEDAAASVSAIDRAGIRINKVHISCALQLDRPMENREGRAALRQYIEPRYLHQTIGRTRDGRNVRAVDLDSNLLDHPSTDLATSPAWRIHFHVPVDAEQLGPLGTTRNDLRQALAAVQTLDYAPHLEVETYTWEVLPNAASADLAAGLSRELIATENLLSTLETRR